MKFYFKLKEIGLAIVLMGLSGFVFADLNRGSVKVPVVMDDSGKEVSFDYTETGADQASSGTCATNPSEGNSDVITQSILEEPIPKAEPMRAMSLMSFAATAAPRSFGAFDDSPSTPAYQSTNNDRSFEEPEEGEGGKDGPPTPPTTPEPATLLIIGMSLAGLAPLVRRYRREQTSH